MILENLLGLNFFQCMHFYPDFVVQGALIGACRIHLNLNMNDERAAKHFFELEPKNVRTYVLISNIYAMTIWWDVVAKMRQMIKTQGIRKVPYSS